MSDTPPRKARREHPPEVWADARAQYLAGVSGAIIEQRTGIAERTLRQRAYRNDWTRKKVWAARAAALPAWTPPAPAADPSDPVDIVRLTLARAMDALAAGRATEASAIIKAGDAIGQFSDLLGRLEAVRGARMHGDSRE